MPKVATARLHVCLRILELAINFVGMGVLFGSAIWLFDRIDEGKQYMYYDDDDGFLITLVVTCLILVVCYNF